MASSLYPSHLKGAVRNALLLLGNCGAVETSMESANGCHNNNWPSEGTEYIKSALFDTIGEDMEESQMSSAGLSSLGRLEKVT